LFMWVVLDPPNGIRADDVFGWAKRGGMMDTMDELGEVTRRC